MRGAWLVMALATGAWAQDYVRTVANVTGTAQTCVTWSDRSFEYRVDAAGSMRTPGETELTAIDAAFASWQAVANTCSDFVFQRGARLSDGAVGQNTQTENLVIFRDRACRDVVPEGALCTNDNTCGNVFRCWDHSVGTIALTTVTYSTRTGVAVDADIELNSAAFLMTTISTPPCEAGSPSVQCVAFDVQNTMTHEIGHAVGLDHVSRGDSTMAPMAPLGELTKRVIDPGTAKGLCDIYPRGQPPSSCSGQTAQRLVAGENRGSFGLGCSQFSFSAVGLALLLLRRRR